MPLPELEDLADAITALAGARNRVPLPTLLRETALNVLILSRIASNRLPDDLRKDDIESAADHLVTQLRHAAWELPPPATPRIPLPPRPRPTPARPLCRRHLIKPT
ncbi:hypothetical protein [Glycomyces terrestris]|uniref:Uncharacterized protein n=1 Tax=Glycomyces terrestris TaxID=2493553 RepID=A0A426V5K1_9ACTN|nr:hypothetical protein [Glycomyces terrestris]RRS02111.1 hypothetical protein EIW28_05090 [Glycomyces terrestris]